MDDQLPIGRVALAKSACVDWVFDHAKVVLGGLMVLVLFLFGAAQLSRASVKKGRMEGLVSPYYMEFARVSSWMQEEQWDRALEATRAMRQRMKGDDAFWVHSGSVLYLYNLLRLIALERKVGSAEGELMAIDELLASVDPSDPQAGPLDKEACAMVSSVFQDGTLSLKDYLHQRRVALH